MSHVHIEKSLITYIFFSIQISFIYISLYTCIYFDVLPAHKNNIHGSAAISPIGKFFNSSNVHDSIRLRRPCDEVVVVEKEEENPSRFRSSYSSQGGSTKMTSNS